jgi:hypothetical protein
MRFIPRRVPIDAIQWTGANIQEVAEFVAGCKLEIADRDPVTTFAITCGPKTVIHFDYTVSPPRLLLTTPGGVNVPVMVGEWVIKMALGGFRSCNPIVFDATYEPET